MIGEEDGRISRRVSVKERKVKPSEKTMSLRGKKTEFRKKQRYSVGKRRKTQKEESDKVI